MELERVLSDDLERVASEKEEDEESIHITVQRSDGSEELVLAVNKHHDALEERNTLTVQWLLC